MTIDVDEDLMTSTAVRRNAIHAKTAGSVVTAPIALMTSDDVAIAPTAEMTSNGVVIAQTALITADGVVTTHVIRLKNGLSADAAVAAEKSDRVTGSTEMTKSANRNHVAMVTSAEEESGSDVKTTNDVRRAASTLRSERKRRRPKRKSERRMRKGSRRRRDTTPRHHHRRRALPVRVRTAPATATRVTITQTGRRSGRPSCAHLLSR